MLVGDLRFDPAAHVYTVGGQDVPGVTTVLKPLTAAEYAFVPREQMERAALLGQAVHQLIHFDQKGTLDEASLDPVLVPYLAMWRTFLATSGFMPVMSEQQVLSRRYGFAGTLDLFGTIRGEASLIDAKRTAAVPRTAGPQTAAYEIALREMYPDAVSHCASGPNGGRINRYALHLMPDRWQLVPFRDPNDARVFLSALTLKPWLERRAA